VFAASAPGACVCVFFLLGGGGVGCNESVSLSLSHAHIHTHTHNIYIYKGHLETALAAHSWLGLVIGTVYATRAAISRSGVMAEGGRGALDRRVLGVLRQVFDFGAFVCV
jgi:hypothetical protein